MKNLQTKPQSSPAPQELISVYDNGGFTIDRYTISLCIDKGDEDAQYFLVATNAVASVWSVAENTVIHSGDDEACHEKHIGNEIDWSDLPNELQSLIIHYFSLDTP